MPSKLHAIERRALLMLGAANLQQRLPALETATFQPPGQLGPQGLPLQLPIGCTMGTALVSR